MWIKRLGLCLLICISSWKGYSQTDWTEWNEQLGIDESSVDWQALYEELGEVAEQPFNINTITKDQLERLPFLSDQLIESILYHVYKYGPLQSENELWGIEGMSWKVRKLLSHFIEIGPAAQKPLWKWKHDLWKYNQQELITRVDIPFQQKVGYAAYPQEVMDKSPNKRYQGSACYTNLRYRFHYRDQVYAGLTAEKDAGEPFFSQYNRKGYDSYTGYLFLRKIGRVESLVLGHYRASFGYGLVMNTGGFFFNQWVNILSATRAGQGLNKYSSVGEAGYLQGVGMTYRLSKRWLLTGFCSSGKQDGRVEEGFIRSFKTDGYHRLQSDLEKKHTISNQLVGGYLCYNGKYIEGGLTAVYNVFNKVLNPVSHPYNLYNPRGKEFASIGGHYKWFFGRWILAGETAVDRTGKIATLNMLTYSPTVNTTFLLMNRYYDKAFQGMYAQTFSENSSVRNEIGYYIGLETNLMKNITFSGHVDFFHFPYRRFQVDALHTSGIAGGGQISYSPTHSLTMLIKYNYSNKAKNDGNEEGDRQVVPFIRQRIQGQLRYSPSEQLRLKTVLEYVQSGFWKQMPAKGWLAGNTVQWSPAGRPLQVSVSGAWFQADTYDARVYLYEPHVLYAYALSSFYGKGMRYSALLKYTWKNRWVLQARYAWTHYFNRDKIGSGLEEIQGSNKSELVLQLRWKW